MKIKNILFALTVAAVTAHADNAAVLALFDKRCAECHSDGDEKPGLNAGINLASLLGSPDDVKAILDRVSRPDEAKGRMPKRKGKTGTPGYKPPLTKEDLETLAAWASGKNTAPAVAATTPATPAPSSSG